MSYMNLFLIKQELEKENKEYNSQSILNITINRDEFLKFKNVVEATTPEEINSFRSDLFQYVIDLSLEEINDCIENNINPEVKTIDFKETLKKLEEKYEFSFEEELGKVRISKENKEILKELMDGSDKILSFFNNEILFDLNVKNSSEDFIESVNVAFFDENIHDFLFKNNSKKEIKEYNEFFSYFINQYSPSSKTEGFSKLYAYCISGNLFEDYKNNKNNIKQKYKEAKENPTEDNINILKQGIKERCIQLYIPLKLQKIKELSGSYNKYITEGFLERTSEQQKESFFTKTPPGFFDYVIKDAKNENKYLLFRTTANLQENDIYKHDESRISEDFAIQEYSKSNKVEIEVFDLYKSHKTKDLYKMDFVNDENIEEIKEIFDTSVNISVSNFTGMHSNLIFLGDKQYSKEYLKDKDYYDLATKVLDTMLENGNNPKVKDLAINVIKWLDKNISVENDLENRAVLIDKINPLLKKIRSKYRDDNDVINVVKPAINALGNGSPNKAYASSLINEKIDKYNKEKAILKNINNINPLDVFSIKERDSLNENVNKFAETFLKYHNLINDMEYDFVRNNSTRLKQVICDGLENNNTVIAQYKKINDFFFPLKTNNEKRDYIFEERDEYDGYNVNITKNTIENLKKSRNFIDGIKKEGALKEIKEILNDFSSVFNMENIQKEFPNSQTNYSNPNIQFKYGDKQKNLKRKNPEILKIQKIKYQKMILKWKI